MERWIAFAPSHCSSLAAVAIMGMLYRWGKVAVRFRWPIIAFWVVGLAVLSPFVFRVSSHLKAGFGQIATESDKALEVLGEEWRIKGTSITLVFSSNPLTAADPRYFQEMSGVVASLNEMPQVAEVLTPAKPGDPHMVSADGRMAYATVLLKVGLDEAMELYSVLKEKACDTEHLRVWSTGGIPIFAEIRDVSESDLRRVELITFPLVLVAAGLPVALGGASVAVTLGLLYFVAQVTDVSILKPCR